MSRTVMCRKYKTELEGLDKPPYPGPKGEEIYQTVSKRAWSEWVNHQTMIINEKHMNMMDPATRQLLQEEMEKFMDNGDYTQVEGYTPPTNA